MTKAIAHTYNTARAYHVQMIYALIATCAILVFVYAFHVYKVIANTVALQKVEAHMASLSGTVDKLDAQYLELSSIITPDHVAKYGMKQGHVSEYISRQTSLGRVAMSRHEL